MRTMSKLPPTAVASMLTIQSWPICQKQIGISWTISHTDHCLQADQNSKSYHRAAYTWYYRLSIYHGYIYIYVIHQCTQHKNDNDKTSVRFALTNDNSYLALSGQLWGVFRELYEEKWLQYIESTLCWHIYPDNKVHGANMGPTWVLLAPDGPHDGPMNLAIRV